MRLLNVQSLESREFHDAAIPKYAIASHRWVEGTEASIKDIRKRRNMEGQGYDKVMGYAQFVKRTLVDIQWLWIDTCCINQDSAVELSEAVNSMFRWYSGAEVCVAYLADVQAPRHNEELCQSAWFTRGWTLQELLASRFVVFVTRDWEVIGHKGSQNTSCLDVGPAVDKLVSVRTGIPENLVREFKHMECYGVEDVLRWMTGRETTRGEDMSYSLFGILDVNIWLNYGEGADKARGRLLAEVAKKTRHSDAKDDSNSSSRPMVTHTLPFRRDPDFVDRPELHLLWEKLSMPAARVALLGIGGIGKSQLAIESCYRIRAYSPGMRDIADAAKIPGRDSAISNVLRLVHNWLNDALSGPWLIVLDNADDAKFLFEESQQSSHTKMSHHSRPARRLIEYIPASDHGSVVLTTRDHETALRLVDHDEKSIIALRLMTSDEASTLLFNKLGQENAESAEKLVNALGFIPLAIAQAAAYIQQQQCSLRVYLRKIEKSEHHCAKVLDLAWHAPRRDLREAQNSITRTWQVSFDQIRKARKTAADLLSLMAFYNHQDIPFSLLRGIPSGLDGEDFDTDGSSSTSLDEALEEDLIVLRNFLLISDIKGASALTMHRLVQLATKSWLISQGTYTNWWNQSVVNLQAVLPGMDYVNWPVWRMIYPHVKTMFAAGEERNDCDSLQFSYVLSGATVYALQQGSIADAEALSDRCKELREKLLGREHPHTLVSMDLLAQTYCGQERLSEAERLHKRVLQSRKRVLGTRNAHTLNSMHNLATTYSAQKRFAKAKKIELHVLQLQRTEIGEHHPNTLKSLSNLAWTYYKQGNLVKAEQLELRALKRRKKILGEEHPDTLTSMTHLVAIYCSQSRLAKAERFGEQVLHLRKQVLGEEHPHTLISLCQLASIYVSQGRLAEAGPLQLRAFELRKKVLGEEHSDTLMSMGQVANMYLSQGQLIEAERLETQLLDLRRRVLNGEHRDTLMSMGNLAAIFIAQRRLPEAKRLELQVLELRKKALGEGHPDTLTSMDHLALIYLAEGQLTETEDLQQRVLQLRKNELGEEHPDTLTSMEHLANTRRHQERLAEAEQLELRVLESRQRLLGEEHRETLTSLSNLSSTCLAQRRLLEAEQYEAMALELRKKVLGEEHPDTLTSMGGLVYTYCCQGRFMEAEQLGRKVLDSRKRLLGGNHHDTLMSTHNLALIHSAQGRWAEAKQLELEVLKLQKDMHGDTHPDTLLTVNNLAYIYYRQGHLPDAPLIRSRVLELQQEAP